MDDGWWKSGRRIPSEEGWTRDRRTLAELLCALREERRIQGYLWKSQPPDLAADGMFLPETAFVVE